MDDGIAKLTDFGLNEALGQTHMENPIHEPLSRESMGYCPPEIHSPHVVHLWDSAAGDVYMFGILYVHIFEGELPWTGFTLKDIVAAIVHKQIPPRPADDSVAAQHGFMDDDWEICINCWTADPAVRPAITAVMRMIIHRSPSDHHSDMLFSSDDSQSSCQVEPEQQQQLSSANDELSYVLHDTSSSAVETHPHPESATPDEHRIETTSRFALTATIQDVLHMFG